MMDLKDCYTKFGGDYDEVLGRLQRERIVEKFVYKFLDDKSFELLETSIKNEDYGEALRDVHTIKGICQNLSFTKLYEISNLMTKTLKENDYQKAVDMMPQLTDDYYKIIHTVQEYKQSKEG